MKKYYYQTEKVRVDLRKYQKRILKQALSSKYFSLYKQAQYKKYLQIDKQIKSLRNLNKYMKSAEIKEQIKYLKEQQQTAYRKALGLKKDYTLRKNQKKFIISKEGYAIIETKKELSKSPYIGFKKAGVDNYEDFMRVYIDQIKPALEYMGAMNYYEEFKTPTSRSWIRRTMNKANIDSSISVDTFLKWLKSTTF